MTADLARTSAAFAASLAIHLAVLAMLIGRGAVLLTIEPSPILLTFVEAAHRTAGPGEPSSRLRSPPPRAAPPSSTAPAPSSQPSAGEASLSGVPAASRPKPAPPQQAVPVPAPALREKPMAAPARRPQQRKPAPPAVASAPDTAASGGTAGTRAPALARPSPGTAPASGSAASGTGSDARATSPSWAPAAKIRYEEVLYAWIDRHKQYPMLAQRRGIEGSGSVRVRIDRDGRVLERSLVRSTGASLLDEAALDIVRRASPFPAVPKEYPGANFEFVAPIEYRLR